MPYPDDGNLNGRNNKESGSTKDNIGSLNPNGTAQTALKDLIDIRKKKILNAIKDNPETTIEALSSSIFNSRKNNLQRNRMAKIFLFTPYYLSNYNGYR